MGEHPDIVFEASFEVANKVGGIYTVITSKIPFMQMNYDAYYLIGPLWDDVPEEVLVERPPATFQKVFNQLAAEGIRCVYGRWRVKGSPQVILIDARSLQPHLNDIKKVLWDEFHVDSMFSEYDFHEPLLWSWGVGKCLEQFAKVFNDKKLLLHAHEWLSGFSILYAKLHQLQLKTVFTTHATMLGRSLAARDQLYSQPFEYIDAPNRAKEIGVADKHSTENACAHAADIFSTVSDTTADEATAFFGRKPEVLPNGITTELFPTFEETTFNHIKHKELLQQVVMAHFFPHYTFDIQHTLFFYTSGRYEYGNKGYDVIIQSLKELNEYLIAQDSNRHVVFFFFVATGNNGPQPEIVESRNRLYDLMHDLHEKSHDFMKQLILEAFNKNKTSVLQAMIRDVEHAVSFMKRNGNPPLSSFKIDESQDPVINALHAAGLDNREENKVKIVFAPAYIDGSDGIFNMEYYELVSACHLGVFPSKYEPWGYTPLESLAIGVPAITSHRAGFGQYMKDKIIGQYPGLYVIENKDEITTIFKTFADYHHNERVAAKMNAHGLALSADWRELVKNYLRIHDM